MVTAAGVGMGEQCGLCMKCGNGVCSVYVLRSVH